MQGGEGPVLKVVQQRGLAKARALCNAEPRALQHLAARDRFDQPSHCADAARPPVEARRGWARFVNTKRRRISLRIGFWVRHLLSADPRAKRIYDDNARDVRQLLPLRFMERHPGTGGEASWGAAGRRPMLHLLRPPSRKEPEAFRALRVTRGAD